MDECALYTNNLSLSKYSLTVKLVKAHKELGGSFSRAFVSNTVRCLNDGFCHFVLVLLVL